MIKKEGKELATVKVYLNTGIIAGLIGVGFIASTLVFGVLLLVLKYLFKKDLNSFSLDFEKSCEQIDLTFYVFV